MQPHSTPARIPELDGLRGLAISCAISSHYFHDPLQPFNEALQWLRTGTALFWSSIDLFFILSGYLIGSALIQQKASPRYFSTFYARRFTRTLPLYYLLLVIYWLVSHSPLAVQVPWLVQNPLPYWPYWVLLQTYFIGEAGHTGAPMLAPMWSLGVEEHFYLLVPLFLRWAPTRRLPLWIALLMVFSVACRFYMPWMHNYMALPCRLDSLLAGMLLAWACLHPPTLAFLQKHTKVWRLLFWAMLAVMAYWSWAFRQWHFLMNEMFIVFYGTCLLLTLFDKQSLLATVCRWHWLQHLGIVSYSIYIFHQPIQGLVHGLWLGQAPTIAQWQHLGATLLALGITLVVASASYHYFERYFLAIGKRFRW